MMNAFLFLWLSRKFSLHAEQAQGALIEIRSYFDHPQKLLLKLYIILFT